MDKDTGLHYAGAAATALVGILHLVIVPYFVGFGSNTTIFFIATVVLARNCWYCSIDRAIS